MQTATAQTPDTAQISAIVPTFRRLDILQRCLAAIAASARPFSQIIVITRPLEDPETFEWLSGQIGKIDTLEIVEAHEAGVVCALNAGLAHATGDFIAIFDDDALPHPDWLDRVLAHFSDPQVACAGGRDLVHQNGQIITGTTTTPGQRTAFGILRGGHHLAEGAARRVDSIKGCNWILRRVAIGTVRLDERLFGKGAQIANETWYCENLAHAGWKIIFDPSARVDHFPAERADGPRDVYSRIRCHDQTANVVAADLAFASPWTRVKYIGYSIFKGHRYCPGLFFIAHALAKRPKSLPDMLIGGWSGFFEGLSLARRFRNDPPGRAAPMPQGSAPQDSAP
ncbi:glycosyltransferase family 2 protein [Albirhodobacter sp. R86504]|uniref:glycosyltransferase family 2 protein n=1 Tax=Albirhodobacter sp. R86504 TaxID=3093848 RepID=UPI003673040A